jgi:hypothetical protein
MKRYLMMSAALLGSVMLLSLYPNSAEAEFSAVCAHVSALGVDANANVVGVLGGYGGGCPYDLVYFSRDSSFGRSAMATLLAAKMSGSGVSIFYDVDQDSGVCMLKRTFLCG